MLLARATLRKASQVRVPLALRHDLTFLALIVESTSSHRRVHSSRADVWIREVAIPVVVQLRFQSKNVVVPVPIYGIEMLTSFGHSAFSGIRPGRGVTSAH